MTTVYESVTVADLLSSMQCLPTQRGIAECEYLPSDAFEIFIITGGRVSVSGTVLERRSRNNDLRIT